MHVVTVLLWIGGVSFVTIIIFPMLVRMGDSLEKVLMFQSVENVFVRLARYYVVVVGITGFLLLYLTDQFSKLFTMETLGITFMLIVWGLYSFILLFERKIFAKLFADSKKYDPDKIMVGEMRDSETAQIAVQSALTGHLVFTTVHANNVFDVMSRFMHMEVDPYSFVSALNGILAQRLVRVNCPHCSIEDHPSATLLADSGLDEQTAATMHFRVGKGCEHCRGTGFKGRRAIAEILTLNDEIRELIIARQPLRILREAAKRNGTRFLREIALDMVASGESTLQEINRATFVIR